MKCYYDVLNISREVNDDDLKKSYRKLALKWHPDKNPDNLEEANREFLLVQRAYEVLSDPHERAWYDRHRESILKGAGSGYQDESLDIWPYFNTSCYKGMDDSENGFYTIYREVFNKLAAEESEYLEDDDHVPPQFGNSESPYEEVNKFYGFWRSFCTKKSYSWLYTYDITEAENRRILRLMEQENKRVREKSKKERNEEIRELVEFVRKRDERVHAYAEFLRKKVEENNRKTEEHRKRMIQQRKKDLETYKESEWSKFSNLEKELKEIESSMASEFKDESDDDSEVDELLCAACNKSFRNEKTFSNHEKSKKHQENVGLLKKTMVEEEQMMNGNESEEDEDNEVEGEEEIVSDEFVEVEDERKSESPVLAKKERNKSKKKKKMNQRPIDSNEGGEKDLLELAGSKKQRKKREREKIMREKIHDIVEEDGPRDCDAKIEYNSKSKKNKNNKKTNNVNDQEVVNSSDLASCKRKQGKQEHEKLMNENKITENDDELPKSSKKENKKQKGVNKNKSDTGTVPTLNTDQISHLDLDHSCATCHQSFNSKNKLFQHLESTGHQIFLPNKVNVKPVKPNKKKK